MSFFLLLSMVEMMEMVTSSSQLLEVIEGGTAGKCNPLKLKSSRRGLVLSGGGAGIVVDTRSRRDDEGEQSENWPAVMIGIAARRQNDDGRESCDLAQALSSH